MKALVVYDSVYGNTKKLAEIIAMQLGKGVKAVLVSEVKKEDLAGLDLIVVGCPVNAWRPTQKTTRFLEGLAKDQLKEVNAAAFDTRMPSSLAGDAAGKISRLLKHAGAKNIIRPAHFTVKGREGPLQDDALDKAKEWADTLV